MTTKNNFIRKKILLLSLIIFNVGYFVQANAQTEDARLTKGKVVDTSGAPIPGVTVSLLDDFKAVFTDRNGEFSIDVPVGSLLFFSHQGWLPEKVEVTKRGSRINVVLQPENKVNIYNIGYRTCTEPELTNAVSVITANDLKRTSVTSAENAMAGKAAGLTVIQNLGNEPGYESSSLYIRGIGTENAMRSPYVLVDDIERNFSQLDIHEIESVTILKDGAANSQYGQRGANGTILVTTKRGFVGKPEIEFISQVGSQQPTRLPQFLGAKEYVTFYNKALLNDGLLTSADPKYNPSTYNGSQDMLRYPDINWYKTFLKSSAPQQQYKLMFRGGNDKIRYFMLLGYLNQQGLYKYTEENNGYSTNIKYNRFNIRTNLDANVTTSTLVSLDLAGRMENRNMPNSSAGDIFSTLSSLVANAMPLQYTDSMLAGTSHYRNNPLGMLSRTGYRQDRNIALQLKLKLTQDLSEITEGLKAEVAFGYDANSSYGLYKSQSYATYELQANDTYTKYGEDIPLSLNMSAINKGYDYLLGIYGGFSYDRLFNRHSVKADLRYYQSHTYIRGDNPPYGKQGVNGRFSYNFGQRYFVDFTCSYDGSDEFAKGHRFGFFPGISGGWLISNEQFLKNNNLVTFLKLRASYGEAGNCKTSGLDRYAYQSHWYGFDGAWGGYIFGSGFAWSDGSWEGRIANPDLTWETTRNYNFGIDLTLLKKLSFTVDGFLHNRDNIILEMSNSTSGIVGSPAPYVNAGAVINKGFETSLSYNDKAGRLNYYVQANVSFARNRITKTDELENLAENLKRTGHSVTQQFGMQAEGFYSSQEDIENSPVNTLYKVRPGDIKYKDVNKDNVINELDETAIGTPQVPEWTFGFSSGCEYRGFDFSFTLSALANRSVYLNNNAVWILQNNGNVTDLAYGAWEKGVRESNATYPRLTTEVNRNNYRLSSFWVENGNFVRLSNVEIGYVIPSKISRCLKLKEIRLYANGQNLWSFDSLGKYHLDPEVVDAGVTGYPVMKVFNVGLNLKF